jgi:hypothetical protein
MLDNDFLFKMNSVYDKLTIEQLDHALLFYYQTSNSETFNSALYDSITAKFDLGLFQQQLIIEKLLKDEFVQVKQKDFSITDVPNKTERIFKDVNHYQITFDGILFHEQGGYSAFQQRERERHEFEKRKMRLELKQMRSNLITNRTSRSNNKLLPAFAGLAAFIAAIGLVSGIIQGNKQDKLIELLKRQMTQQDSVLKIHQTQIDSLFRESKPLDSVKNVHKKTTIN